MAVDPIKLHLQKQVKGHSLPVGGSWLTPAVGDGKPPKPDFHLREIILAEAQRRD